LEELIPTSLTAKIIGFPLQLGANGAARGDTHPANRVDFHNFNSLKAGTFSKAAPSVLTIIDPNAGNVQHRPHMKALFLSNEYPPYVYGGAGIHVEYLSRELAKLMQIEVRCFGDQDETKGNLRAIGFPLDSSAFTCPKQLASVFGAVKRGTDFNTTNIDADVVHCHTWYTHLGGILAKLNYGIPLVITVHSLEPLRPWKREQLGGGYDFSCWVEKTAIEMADAIIAVSQETKTDILNLFNIPEERICSIYNGIDLDEYQATPSRAALSQHGIDPAVPYVLFVGRITRQKGIVHLVNAIKHMDPGFQILLCA
jgi:glycogen synthase